MLIFIILLIGILFLDVKVTSAGEFHTDYCSHKQTATINGIFTILIFLSHASGYVELGGALDAPYLALQKYMGQMVVTSFLFFTGFGMMESISKKGMAYVKGIPFKRFFRVWYHFAVAICIFIVTNLICGRQYDLKQILLSFTGYRAIGNSNWYMFVTFVMYIIIFVSFIIARKPKILGVALVFALTLGFIYLESEKLGLETRYYNTIMCVPAGMLFSLIKPYFDKIVMKNDIFWAFGTAIVFAVYYYFHANKGDSYIHHNAFGVMSVVLIMMLLMKVKVGNKILDFFGDHIFSIFILQRIPMIFLERFGFTDHKYAFIVVSFIATVCIALIFDWAMSQTDKLIYNRKKV